MNGETGDEMILNGKPFPTFLRFAVPNILGMLALSSAQIIDAFFIGRFVGGTELASVNIVFPVFSFVFGIGVMLTSGSAVMCAKYIGEKKLNKASEIFTLSLISTFSFVVVCSIAFLLFPDRIVRLLGANAQMEYSSSIYLYYTSFFLVFFLAAHILGVFSKIEERPIFVFSVMLVGAIANIFFDWLFILKYQMGVTGAAVGTGISQILMVILLVPYFFSPKCRLKIVNLKIKSAKKLLKAAYNGLSELVNEFSIGFTSFLFNWIMVTRIGVAGVAAFTIIGYISWFGVIFSYAIGETLTPLVSTNYGAEKHQRIKKFLNISLISGESTCLLLFLFLLWKPEIAVSIFLRPNETEAINISLRFIGVMKWAFFFNGFNIIMASYFTAMHRPLESAVIALLRSLIFPVIFVLMLPKFMEENGLYASIPMSEFITFVIGVILFTHFKKQSKARREAKKLALHGQKAN